MSTMVTIKKWGNSLGILLPADIVQMQNLKAGEQVHILVRKPADLRSIFGKLKTNKTAQELKDMARDLSE